MDDGRGPGPRSRGAVTALEAHGDTVYAVLASDEQARIRPDQSPVGHDDFALVDTGHALGDVSQLVVSDHVVAFLNSTGDGNRIVELSRRLDLEPVEPVPAGTGDADRQLSTAADSLWVLCTAGPKATVWVRPDTSASWSRTATRTTPRRSSPRCRRRLHWSPR